VLLFWNFPIASERAPSGPMHGDLDKEFGRITPAPNSVPVNRGSPYKAGTARVQTEYGTRASFTKLRAHYESELERNGWRFRTNP